MKFIDYNGFRGTVEFAAEDGVYLGHVIGIRDVVSYEGKTINELITDFHDAVDDYLAFLQRVGRKIETGRKETDNQYA